MKERVVCIDDDWVEPSGEISTKSNPIKGEIYTVLRMQLEKTNFGTPINAYVLYEFPNNWYSALNFRPVDDTFGSWVEHTLMPLVQIEQFEKENRS